MPQGMFCVHTRLARRLAGFSCVEVRRRFHEFPEKLPRPLRERGSIPPNCVNKQEGHPVNLGGLLVCWWAGVHPIPDSTAYFERNSLNSALKCAPVHVTRNVRLLPNTPVRFRIYLDSHA